jgi:hypothetical protein
LLNHFDADLQLEVDTAAASYACWMQRAGGESWRVGIGGAQTVHSLLVVRDMCRLAPSGADVPPPLLGDLPTIDFDLDSEEREEMSAGWLNWWRRSVHVEGAIQRGEFARTADSNEGRARQRTAVFEAFDSPDFASLADSPALQDASRRVCDQALRWENERRGRPRPHGRESHERKTAWLAQKSVAESVIEEDQVNPDRVCAGVIVLAVTGQWSNIPEPGVLLCSEEFFADGELFLPALKMTFETGLRRQPAT